MKGIEQLLVIEWQECELREDSGKPEVCMSPEEIVSWFRIHRSTFWLLFSHNFVDYNAKSDYVKFSAMVANIDNLDYDQQIEVTVPTTVH